MFNPLAVGMAKRLKDQMGPGSGLASPFLKLRRQSLLFPAEKDALEILRVFSATKDLLICPQVHVLQIFGFDDAGFEEAFDAYASRLAKEQYVLKDYVPKAKAVLQDWSYKRAYRSVDFLCCDRQTTDIQFGIEIDGLSHDDPKQQESDEVKDMMFASANIPLYRFTNAEIASVKNLPSDQWENAFSLIAESAATAWEKRCAYFFRKT
jgi:hypothetical protein